MSKLKELDYRAVFNTDEKKAAAFDEIAARFYQHNFGTLSKTDMDTLMFKLYLETLIEVQKDENSFIDYSFFSDYKLGQVLGLTPTKIRNLKLKKELQYPQGDYDWKKSLLNLLSDERNLRIESNDMVLLVRDPNLFNAIRDGLEDLGGFVDITMNTNLLRVDGKTLLLLLEQIEENEGETEQVLKDLNKALKKANAGNPVEVVFDTSNNLLEILQHVLELTGELPVVGTAFSIGKAVIAIGKTVNKVMKGRKTK